MTKTTWTPFALIALLWLPIAAQAAGTNFFHQGLSHPLMIPAQLIVCFALALLIGQQGGSHLRYVLPAFAVALAIGLLLTRHYRASWDSESVLLPLAAIAGLLVVLKLQLPVVIALVIAILSGLTIGMDSAVPMIPGLQARKIYASLAGSGLTVFGIVLVISLIAWTLRNLFEGVALRVFGAWATAGAVLVLSLRLANVSSI